MSVLTVSQSPILSQPFSLMTEGNADEPFNLLSTTHKRENLSERISSELLSDIEFEIEQSEALQAEQCERGAPFICYQDGQTRWHLVQGCCNNWLCARCGHIRARQEFARMIEGVKHLTDQGHKLYHVILTCRGREIALEAAEAHYYQWTNKLLTDCREQARRTGQFWAYVQVTERQERGHPHSHLITTFLPVDAVLTHDSETGHEIYVSLWFDQRNESAGLGSQHKIIPVRSEIGLAVYLSKYLFKTCMTTPWPPRWKRIRYGSKWPQMTSIALPGGFPVLSPADWRRVAALPGLVYADSNITYERALARLITNVVFVG